MSDAIETGDLVRLKSGGPVMTAAEERSDGIRQVEYFRGEEHIVEAFPPAMLEKLPPEAAKFIVAPPGLVLDMDRNRLESR